MKKIFGHIVCTALIGIMLVGCASSKVAANSTEATMPSDAVDVEWLGVGTYVGDDGYMYYAVGAKNPNTDYSISNLTATYQAWRDEKVIISEDIVFPELLPGETRYIAARLGNGTAPDRAQGAYVSDSAIWTKTDRRFVQYFDTVNNKVSYTENHGKIFTGEVVLREGVDPSGTTDSVTVVVIGKRPDGSIVYGLQDTIEDYEAGKPAAYEIVFDEFWGLGDVDTEVYAYPG